MRVALFHNPSAGGGGLSTDRLLSLLRAGGHDPVEVPGGSDLREVLEAQRIDFVAVAGGDGTVRKVALALVGSGVAIAPLPIGTANNIAQALGVRGRPEEIIAGWASRRLCPFDVGRARGPWGECHFIEGGGLGLIGRGIGIIEEIDESSGREFAHPEDKLHRDLSVFVALAHELPAVPLELWVDERELGGDYLLLEVLNVRHAGPRIELAREAQPDDGLFDVVLAQGKEREKLTRGLREGMAGVPFRPALTNLKASRVRLRLPPTEFRLDDKVVLEKPRGGVGANTSVEVELSILPGALSFVVPGGR